MNQIATSEWGFPLVIYLTVELVVKPQHTLNLKRLSCCMISVLFLLDLLDKLINVQTFTFFVLLPVRSI